MSLVADLNQNRGKGAALFQKRKARSEKWVVDENNVKKQGYQPTSTHIGVSSASEAVLMSHACLPSADDTAMGPSCTLIVVRRRSTVFRTELFSRSTEVQSTSSLC